MVDERDNADCGKETMMQELPAESAEDAKTPDVGIEAHRNLEDTLRGSMEMFRLVAEHAYDGFNICEREITRDSAGRPRVKRSLIYSNDRFVAMSGYSREELLAASDLNEFLISCLTPEENEANMRRLERGLTCRGVSSWMRPDRQENYHEWVAVTVLLHGRTCLFGIDRDITWQRRAQEALRKAHDELAERMQDRTEQLRQARRVEAIGQLVGGAAHEFNNLLLVINGQAELVLKGLAPNDPLRSQVELILKTGERFANLTNRLLALSQRQALQPKPLDLNETIGDISKLLQAQIPEAITVKMVLDPALKPTLADPGQMSRMFVNLALNARDAMPHGGALTIETANISLDQAYCSQRLGVKPGPYVMLALSDTGCGMSEDVKAHLFEPFFTTKEPGEGTGLGLSAIYGIVKQSGGHIEVSSEVGKGTTFKVYLPQATAEIKQAPDLSQARALRGSEMVLVVEDEEKVRALVCHALRSNGYSVISATGGHEAISACERNKGAIHLVVADVIMPEMNGTELVKSLRRLQPGIRVLLMSGYTDPRQSNPGLASLNTHFIQKPFSFGALARKAREALDSPVEAQAGQKA